MVHFFMHLLLSFVLQLADMFWHLGAEPSTDQCIDREAKDMCGDQKRMMCRTCASVLQINHTDLCIFHIFYTYSYIISVWRRLRSPRRL